MMGRRTAFRAKVVVKGKNTEVFYAMHMKPSINRKTCECKSMTNISTVIIVVKKVTVNGTRLSSKDHAARAAAREVRSTLKDGGALCETCLSNLQEIASKCDPKGQIFMC